MLLGTKLEEKIIKYAIDNHGLKKIFLIEQDVNDQLVIITSGNNHESTVSRVIDGDTIELSNGKVIRYIGIDTPELRGENENTCFGLEAAKENVRLVLGKKVRLEKDVSETDKYGRLLRYVWIEDRMINEELVKTGYAKSATYPPDIKYFERFKDAESSAFSNKLGLWQKCNNDKVK